MNLNDFLLKQREIKADMRRVEREESRVTGIRPDPGLIGRRGGFYLSLINEPEITEKAAAFSAKVGALTPAMVYSAADIHTTAGWITESVKEHFYFDPTSPEHRNSLEALITIAYEISRVVRTCQCEVDFCYRLNLIPTGILAVGKPNQDIIDVANLVVDRGTRLGVKMSPPRVIHASLTRFTKARQPEELSEIFQLLEDEPPLGPSRPIGIAAGYTLRNESERFVEDLRETPGHFRSVKFFPFE